MSDDSEIPTGAFNQRHAELAVDVTMKVVDYELGAKIDVWDRKAHINSAIFLLPLP